jgi:mercuric ion transport protein
MRARRVGPVKVQLLYFRGCPHVDEARQVLRAALAACGLADVAVEELDVEAATTPTDFRHWGSPTILVNGADVAGEEAPSGVSCRLYSGGQLSGVPPRPLVERRLQEAIES